MLRHTYGVSGFRDAVALTLRQTLMEQHVGLYGALGFSQISGSSILYRGFLRFFRVYALLVPRGCGGYWS